MAKNAAARLRISISIFATAQLTAELHELSLVCGRDTVAAAVVDVGLTDPVPQARIGDPEILGDLRGWLLTQPSKLDRALPELRRVRSGHLNILPETTIVASDRMSANPGEAQQRSQVRVLYRPHDH